MMTHRSMDDSHLQVETETAANSPSPSPQKSSMSDKIPSAHSDLIIAHILSRADQLFADNRKRKPIFNARRKENWKQLVEQLNKQLNCEYSVERVKNNYHYRVTSLKRNISKQLSELPEDADVEESPAYQNLSEIDRLLFHAVRSSGADATKPLIRKKKAKLEPTDFSEDLQFESNGEESSRLFGDLPTATAAIGDSAVIPGLDALLADYSRLTGVEPLPPAEGNPTEEGDLKAVVADLIRTQKETLETVRVSMQKQTEMLNAAVELMRQSAASLERVANPLPCPTCSTNMMDLFLQLSTVNPKVLADLAQNAADLQENELK
ncbi:hypothetical protein M3Y99_01986600 [Aphelenchoides fujianensis]|nr:hypothetical protein M3Y99_01986600 [Aphelenchoides fujianensis]